ncbi:hypothetical protein QA942_27795 [Streptomyces sp. B21-106]|uniref:hypothetical protein n=1 Tax=Streptomyces sp. B21-106 TaxID=3039418 RepID=UPI002FF1C7F0
MAFTVTAGAHRNPLASTLTWLDTSSAAGYVAANPGAASTCTAAVTAATTNVRPRRAKC